MNKLRLMPVITLALVVALALWYFLGYKPFMHIHERWVRRELKGLSSKSEERRLETLDSISNYPCSLWAAEEVLRKHLNDPSDRVSIKCAVLLNQLNSEEVDLEAEATILKLVTPESVKADPELLFSLGLDPLDVPAGSPQLTLSLCEGARAEDPQVRDLALWQLDAYGKRSIAVPFAADLLLDPEYAEVTALRCFFKPSDYESQLISSEDVCRLLRSQNRFAREAVLSLLVSTDVPPPEEGLELLMEIATGSFGFSTGAIQALGKYEDNPPGLLEFTEKLLQLKDTPICGESRQIDAYQIIFGTGGEQSGLRERALPLLPLLESRLDALRSGEPVYAHEKAPLIRALGSMGPGAAEALPLLLEIYNPGDWRHADALAFAATRFGKAGRPAVPGLMEALGLDNEETLIEVMQALTELEPGLAEVRTVALKLVDQRGFEQKATVAEIIAENGFADEEVMERLKSAWRETHGEERERIWDALEKLRQLEATPD